MVTLFTLPSVEINVRKGHVLLTLITAWIEINFLHYKVRCSYLSVLKLKKYNRRNLGMDK